MLNGSEYLRTINIVHKDGTVKPVLSRAKPIDDHKSYIGVVVDVSQEAKHDS